MPTREWREQNRDKIRKYRRDWYKRNKEHATNKSKARKAFIREWLRNIKSLKVCTICGESHISCLVFHHRNPNIKDINISDIINRGWGIERLQVELEKCEVLCSNCHRKLHYKHRGVV